MRVVVLVLVLVVAGCVRPPAEVITSPCSAPFITGLSTNTTPAIRSWCQRNKVELCLPPSGPQTIIEVILDKILFGKRQKPRTKNRDAAAT